MVRRYSPLSDARPQWRNPLYRDVYFGRGGLSGGKFVRDEPDGVSFSYIQDSGTAQAGATSSITLASTASATDDAYKGMSVQLTAGTGSGDDTKTVTAYNGTTKVATVGSAWATAPDSTTTYRIVDRGY